MHLVFIDMTGDKQVHARTHTRTHARTQRRNGAAVEVSSACLRIQCSIALAQTLDARAKNERSDGSRGKARTTPANGNTGPANSFTHVGMSFVSVRRQPVIARQPTSLQRWLTLRYYKYTTGLPRYEDDSYRCGANRQLVFVYVCIAPRL